MSDRRVDQDPMKVMLMQVFVGNLIRDLKDGKVEEVIETLEKALEALNEDGKEESVATPLKEDERLADKPGSATYDWHDVGVTFMQNHEHEGYDVEVADNDGIIVKTHVYLYEWSGYVTPFINAKDATGMVEYLIELNKMERRDGTIIRDE